MLRRLSSSIPRISTRPIVRRYSDGEQFYQSEGYKDVAKAVAVSGYGVTFLYGVDQSYRVDPLSALTSGLAHSVIFGTIIGLPVAATWPVSVPLVALITVARSGMPA